MIHLHNLRICITIVTRFGSLAARAFACVGRFLRGEISLGRLATLARQYHGRFKILPRIVKRSAIACEATPLLNRRGARGRSWAGRSWQAGEKRILPAGRDPCRRSKSVQIHAGGSRPIPAPASRSFRFHLQVRRRSEWPCADRRMRALTRGTSRPTFRSVAPRRSGQARTSSEVRQTAKSEG